MNLEKFPDHGNLETDDHEGLNFHVGGRYYLLSTCCD